MPTARGAGERSRHELRRAVMSHLICISMAIVQERGGLQHPSCEAQHPAEAGGMGGPAGRSWSWFIIARQLN